MKKLSATLFAIAIAGLSFQANAATIAGKVRDISGGLVSQILLTDEVSKSCDAHFEGTLFAANIIVDARTGRVVYKFPGCYAMRERGEVSLSFWNADLNKWVSFTSLTSTYEKTDHFKGWPGAPAGYQDTNLPGQ